MPLDCFGGNHVWTVEAPLPGMTCLCGGVVVPPMSPRESERETLARAIYEAHAKAYHWPDYETHWPNLTDVLKEGWLSAADAAVTLFGRGVTALGGADGTARLSRVLYGRAETPRDYLGGSHARMLYDAADRLAAVHELLAANQCTNCGAFVHPHDGHSPCNHASPDMKWEAALRRIVRVRNALTGVKP